MEENTQLPKEVVEQIRKEEETLFDEIMDSGTSSPINQRLTAYATKLHQANETIKELERQNEKMKSMATGWRPLLEEVLKLDDLEVAHISEELIEKIKSFLYGE